MLWLTRKVYRKECGDRNCTVLDLPDGRRVRFWIVSANRPGEVRVAVDAPRDVTIARGELLPSALECLPDSQQPPDAA